MNHSVLRQCTGLPQCTGGLVTARPPRCVAALALLLTLHAGPSVDLTAALFVRGDVDGNDRVDLTDALRLLRIAFGPAPPPLDCPDAADGNDSGALELDDAFVVLNTLFRPGVSPAPPFPVCGEDPTEDALNCDSYPSCTKEGGPYRPFSATGEMLFPRYRHRAILTRAGHVLVAGGSDERGLTAHDRAEFYDETSGCWFDTDAEGETMVLRAGGRLFFTLDELPDGTVLLLGGKSNILQSKPEPTAELYDPATRVFATLASEPLTPRARHATAALPDGSLLLTAERQLDLPTSDN